MGRVRNSRRRTSKNKQFKKQHDTKRRRRDIDQIQDDLKKVATSGAAAITTNVCNGELEFELDEDLPGRGQFYCTSCARHFADAGTLAVHVKTKDHKRRLKDVAQEQYSQHEADLAAGKSKEVLPPAHPSSADETAAAEAAMGVSS